LIEKVDDKSVASGASLTAFTVTVRVSWDPVFVVYFISNSPFTSWIVVTWILLSTIDAEIFVASKSSDEIVSISSASLSLAKTSIICFPVSSFVSRESGFVTVVSSVFSISTLIVDCTDFPSAVAVTIISNHDDCLSTSLSIIFHVCSSITANCDSIEYIKVLSISSNNSAVVISWPFTSHSTSLTIFVANRTSGASSTANTFQLTVVTFHSTPFETGVYVNEIGPK